MNPATVQSGKQLVLRLVLGAAFLAYSLAALAFAISFVLRRFAGDR